MTREGANEQEYEAGADASGWEQTDLTDLTDLTALTAGRQKAPKFPIEVLGEF